MNLITLDNYKSYKEITSDNSDDKIDFIISHVSKLIKTYCARTFIDNVTITKTEHFDARTSEVTLAEVPLLSVSIVNTSVDGGLNQVTLTKDSVDADGYFVDLESGKVLTQMENLEFLTSVNTPYRSLEITYLGGFTDSSGNPEVPADLKLAVLDLVSYYINDEKTPAKSIASASINNEVDVVVNGFPPHIVRILQLYRILDL